LPDERRDIEAMQLVKHKQISAPDPQRVGFAFTCYSSTATQYDKDAVPYCISVGLDGKCECDCLDFQGRGGACKHIRAAIISLNSLRGSGYSIPPIRIPTSLDEARSLQHQQLSNLLSLLQHNSTNMQCPIQTAATAVETALRTDTAFVTCPTAEIVNGEESDSGECDGKSVTTDEGDEFDFTAIRGGSSAKDALDVQKTARVFFELDQAAPKLEQLATVLEGARMNRSDLVRAIGFVKQLGRLKMELTRMIDNVMLDEGPTATNTKLELAATQHPETPRRNKRGINAIIGPSPEKATKRHKSYGVH
jgi:SWIM zinc finger